MKGSNMGRAILGDIFPDIYRRKNEAPVPQKAEFQKLLELYGMYGLSEDIYYKFLTDINNAIESYNTVGSSDLKKVALQQMQEALQYVDLHAPPDILALAKPFHAIKRSLFSKIKAAYAENGVNTLSKPGKAGIPVARIIADMSPDKADKLMEILHSRVNLQTNLIALYDPDDTTLEAQQWRVFLGGDESNKGYSIVFLNGKNSKNYTVTNLDDGNVKV